MKAYIVSVVTMSDGKQDVQIIGHEAGSADRAHHEHQRSEARFWQGFKTVTGGRYQAAGNIVDAMIEAGKQTI